ncbi:AraC family transcriptional regulator [Paenibacillus humicola]|uniref:AraC family transcriptional regulator n=1 Tax=Paenibacillus humicola TaxID=3110540 RepID=UPI00237A1773|nr:AraC family transcriptional regulator [Paenibacillus humicola]
MVPHPSFLLITERSKRLPFYVSAIGCRYEQEHVRREAGLHLFQWLQCFEGEGVLKLADGKEHAVRPGMGMLLFPGVYHEYYAKGDRWQVDWLTFDGTYVRNLWMDAGIATSSLFTMPDPEGLLAKIRSLQQQVRTQGALNVYTCSSMLYGILTDIIERGIHHRIETVSQQCARLQPVFAYIEANYTQPLTLQALADLLCISPEYLCQLFRKATGLRPFAYINQVRVNRSKPLLIGSPALELERIAAACGFQSASYYCAMFKKYEGVTPGAFRKLYAAPR